MFSPKDENTPLCENKKGFIFPEIIICYASHFGCGPYTCTQIHLYVLILVNICNHSLNFTPWSSFYFTMVCVAWPLKAPTYLPTYLLHEQKKTGLSVQDEVRECVHEHKHKHIYTSIHITEHKCTNPHINTYVNTVPTDIHTYAHIHTQPHFYLALRVTLKAEVLPQSRSAACWGEENHIDFSFAVGSWEHVHNGKVKKK